MFRSAPLRRFAAFAPAISGHVSDTNPATLPSFTELLFYVMAEISRTLEYCSFEIARRRLGYLQAMCTRLMLSVKKAADPGDESWWLGQPTMRIMRFVGDRGGVSKKHETHMDTSVDRHGETQSHA